MSLTSRFIYDASIQRAGNEALDNAERLFLGGYFTAALEVTSRLLTPGPWELNRYTWPIDRLARAHRVHCWACRRPCAPVGMEPAYSLAELDQWTSGAAWALHYVRASQIGTNYPVNYSVVSTGEKV